VPRARPTPPRPELVRRPSGAFGWLDAHLLHEGWLSRLGPNASSVLVLLALAADGQGASFYGRDRMGVLLGLDRAAVDRALARLVELGLVAHRPWSAGHPDGVWQLLPVPSSRPRERGSAVAIGDVLARLGLARGS
jgi:hypothetical protein